MLVLSRKEGESVQIGENITVKVMDIGGGRVRLAFDAPRGVEINREEVAVRIDNERTRSHAKASK